MDTTGSATSGYTYCQRCGEKISPERFMCDVCRQHPNAIVQVSINSTMIDAIATEVAKKLNHPQGE